MHIAFWSPAWPVERHPNGIGTYVHWMKHALEQSRHRVSVFTPILDAMTPEPGVHHVSLQSTRLMRLGDRLLHPGNSDEGRLFAFGKKIGREILRVHRREPIDLIEMEETFGWFEAVRVTTGLPVVVKLHGPAFLTLGAAEKDNPFGRRRQESEAQALPTAEAITAPSRVVLDRTLEQLGLSPKASRQINNPLAFRPDTPLWRLPACDRNTILFVGRFDWVKGADVMLTAFQALAGRRPALKLVFVGPDHGLSDGQGGSVFLRQFLQAHFPPALRSRVDYRGRLPREEVARLRAGALVTVVASRWESQPYTLLEAMLQGCPIVSSDAGACSESLTDGVTGLLARAGDADALAAQIERLLADPDAADAMGSAARQYVLRVHAPARVAAETVEFYKTVLGMAPAVAGAVSLAHRRRGERGAKAADSPA